jgi:hypothetical protein
VGDDIEVFYSEEGSKCFQHALSREDISTAIKFKLGTSPLPMSMLPPWASVVGTSTSAVRRNNRMRMRMLYHYCYYFIDVFHIFFETSSCCICITLSFLCSSFSSQVHTSTLTVTVTRPSTSVNYDAIAKDFPALDKRSVEVAAKLLAQVSKEVGQEVTLSLDGHVMKLVRGKHFYSNATEHLAAVMKMI